MRFAKALAFALILGLVYAEDYSTADTFVEAINGFTSKSYRIFTNSVITDSLIYSGFSVSTAFAFLSAGTRGDTQKEITTALGFPSQSFAESAFKSGLTRVNSMKGLTLSVANKAYVKDSPGLELNPEFKQTAVDVFRSEIEKINFADSGRAIETINAWAAEKTNQKIKKILSEGSINSDTRLVLLNAIYFKGFWDVPFNVNNTRKENFNAYFNKKIQVNMMQRTGVYGLFEHSEWDAKFIELPYKGKEASMVIVLPNKIDGLPEIEKKVATSNLKRDIFDVINPTKIKLKMPKFVIETSLELNDILKLLGITSIFDGSGDLGGLLTTKEPLTVSRSIQKAFIEVNEEGTEAAAVTAILIATLSVQIIPEVVCDRPFLYYIKLSTGEVLFMGQFTGDASKGPEPGSPTPKPENKTPKPESGTPVPTAATKKPTIVVTKRPCYPTPPKSRPRCPTVPKVKPCDPIVPHGPPVTLPAPIYAKGPPLKTCN